MKTPNASTQEIAELSEHLRDVIGNQLSEDELMDLEFFDTDKLAMEHMDLFI